ncbi:DUF1127 domain-containing protein [Roseibium sp. SCPC15]|jgi:uncharacterized protein YjiS (DUF1127 family)|uniref:DUF1127 domain-containing protein n=1 Tax=Roseibium sp. SCP15 TaxID=3141376 RepID=UPI00333AF664
MSLEIDTVFRSRARSRSILWSALAAIARFVRDYMHRRATHRALSGLTSNELRDIGLERTESGYRKLDHYEFERSRRS